MGKFDKKENCDYCNAPMSAKYRNKRFCSPKCRVYYRRENGAVKEDLKIDSKLDEAKLESKGGLLKLMREGKI